MIQVKICSLFPSSRYAVRRIIQAAYEGLRLEHPGLQMAVTEISDPGEIGRYASVLVLPTLVIDEKVVCSGRVPAREEARGWLLEAALIDAEKGA